MATSSIASSLSRCASRSANATGAARGNFASGAEAAVLRVVLAEQKPPHPTLTRFTFWSEPGASMKPPSSGVKGRPVPKKLIRARRASIASFRMPAGSARADRRRPRSARPAARRRCRSRRKADRHPPSAAASTASRRRRSGRRCRDADPRRRARERRARGSGGRLPARRRHRHPSPDRPPTTPS